MACDFQFQIQKRIQRGQRPDQKTLSFIFDDILTGCLFLQKQGTDCDFIRPENIFIGKLDNQQCAKVLNPALVSTVSNFQNLEKKQKICFLSPQQWDCKHRKQDSNLLDSKKSSVFSIALIILHLGLLNKKELQQYGRNWISKEKINQWLIIFRQHYSTELYLILKSMLSFNIKSRPFIRDLQPKLKPILESRPPCLSVYGMKDKQKEQETFQTRTAINLSMRNQQNQQQQKPTRYVDTSIVMSGLSKVYKSKVTGASSQVYQSGASYNGSKKNDMKNGQGNFTFPDGSYYQGTWVDDKMQGKGTLYSKTKEVIYQGVFKNNLFNGIGIYYNLQPNRQQSTYEDLSDQNWIKYEGDFTKGKKNGYGTLKMWDGGVYVGSFTDDLPNGSGSFKKGGITKNGKWNKGIFLVRSQ